MATKTKKDILSEKQTHREALELVKKRYNASVAYLQPYFSHWQDLYKLYRCQLDKGKLPWRSNLFISKTFEIIETLAPRIAEAQKVFKTIPTEGSDVQSAEAYTDLLKYQFYRGDMEAVIEEWVKETLIYGTGIIKVTWGKDDMPIAEVVDVFDFYPDPKARYIEEAKYAIHRVMRDIEDLKDNPNYDQDVISYLEKNNEGTTDSSVERRQTLGVTGISDTDRTRKRFEVLEYWGYFKGEEYLIATTCDRILRCEKNPYKSGMPFVVAVDQKVPHQLYGIGEIEPIESMQNELNDVRNQRMDNIKLSLNNMWHVVAGGVQFEDELVSRPGGIIHLTRVDGLIPNQRQTIDGSAFTEESIIKNDMERTTGVNSPLSGALVSPMGGGSGSSFGGKTASAFNAAIAQSDKRFNSKISQIKRGLVAIGRKFLELDQQFMTKPQVVRIVGEDGESLMEILPEDIKKHFDLDVDIEYVDEIQKMQQNISLLQYLSNLPGFDTAKWVAEQIVAKAGVKDYKKYLLKPKPPQPEMPKTTFQIKGEATPDAVAQLLDKTQGIKSHPELVAALMRHQMAGTTPAEAVQQEHDMEIENQEVQQEQMAQEQLPTNTEE
jgi:hypothetical protein